MKEKVTKVFVSGCTGRMGKMVVDLVNQHPNWKVCGGFGLGKHQYDFPILDVMTVINIPYHFFDWFAIEPNIIIDCSIPILAEIVYYSIAYEYRIPMVCVTENLSRYLINDMQSNNQMKFTPVFQAYNMSTTDTIKAAEFLLEQKPGYYNMDSLCK